MRRGRPNPDDGVRQIQQYVRCLIHGRPFNAKKPTSIGNDTEHIGDVGIIMSKIGTSALIAWKPVSDHIVTARLQANKIKITTIQVYNLTEDAEEAIKDNFYNQLQTTLHKTPGHDLILLMGDFNAKINPNRTGFENVMRPYGSAENISDNDKWAKFRDTTIECAEEVIRRRRVAYKEKWIQDRTWKWINERKDAKRRRDQNNATQNHILVEEAFREADLK
uniref:Endonuclease/exonuclease/phosphatase domain-containing protein n=1 Tax=Biomphalaria glabrata TaxID=6526 RepID=A0A2C9M024_BIOGL